MKLTRQRFFTATPLLLTILLIVWTVSVSPFSQYGDNWAVYPALLVAPLVLIAHILLIALRKGLRFWFLLYALIHSAVFVAIWMNCLMLISKDCL